MNYCYNFAMPNESISVVQEPPVIDKVFVDAGYPFFTTATLTAGDKRVTLKLEGPPPDLGGGRLNVSPRIDKVPNAPRIPGATTAIYIRVREIMQELATTYQQPIDYTFHTRSENMAAWALDDTKGRAIFDWQEESSVDGRTVCKTRINPLSNEVEPQ
jgi:hypothetical protein